MTIKLSSKPITAQVVEVLRNCKIADHPKHGFVLPPQPPVDRKTYEEFNVVLSSIGGKWKTRVGHIFENDPSDDIAFILDHGTIPEINPNSYFPTPDVVADILCAKIVALVGKTARELKVLEPSAGDGALIRAVDHAFESAGHSWEADAIEMDERFSRDLLSHPRVSNLHVADYMSNCVDASVTYDVVVMNPPFSVGRRQVWIDHVMRGIEQTKVGGIFAAIVPRSILFGLTNPFQNLRSLLARTSDNTAVDAVYELPDGSFKESGTNVRTCIVVFKKTCD